MLEEPMPVDAEMPGPPERALLPATRGVLPEAERLRGDHLAAVETQEDDWRASMELAIGDAKTRLGWNDGSTHL